MGIQIVLLPLFLALGEGALRGVMALQGSPYSAEQTRLRVLEIHDRAVNFVPTVTESYPTTVESNEYMVRLPHPFLGYTTTGAVGYVDYLLKNEKKLNDPNAYTIWVFGGSVAQMFARFGRDMFIQGLKADARLADKKIFIVSLGEGGVKQPQQVNFLIYLLSLGLEPDAVLELDGYNEIALGRRNRLFGTNPVFPSIPHWGSLIGGWGGDHEALDLAIRVRGYQKEIERTALRSTELGLHRLAMTGVLVESRLEGLASESSKAQIAFTDYLTSNGKTDVLQGPQQPVEPSEELDEALIRTWFESSLAMHSICSAHNILYVHAIQPNLYHEDSKPLTEEEATRVTKQLPQWLRAVRRCYPKLLEESKKLEARGVPFADMTQAFVRIKGTVYTDNCHYNGKGNRVLARQLAKRFLELM